jgi:hypothetical protein
MSGKIIHLVPPSAAERIREPLPKDPLEGRLVIPAPVSLFGSADGRSHPDVSWIWKISATVTLGMMALALLVVAAFILGTGYDVSNTQKTPARDINATAIEPPVVIVQPSKNPPSLPDTATPRPEIAGDKPLRPQFLHEEYMSGNNRPLAARNVAPKITEPIKATVEAGVVLKEKVSVNALEITHADGETTVHTIGKVEKFKPKEGGKNVQE